MRQVAEIADELYLGVCDDDLMTKYKGPTVFNMKERIEVVEACKWVAKAIPAVPWVTELEYLDEHGCDVAVHGDDICLTDDGQNTYHKIISAGRFATVPRTKAISTTNLIGRMLRLPKEELPSSINPADIEQMAGSASALHTYIPTTKRIVQFGNNKEPERTDRIVYCDGSFDLLHPGHVSFLKKAKALGDYLVVGIHDDASVSSATCTGMPIMTLQERVLNVLAMRYVDDVIIGAPYVITSQLLEQVGASVVVEGSSATRPVKVDAHCVPKQQGIFTQIESDYPDLTARQVVRRVLENYSGFAARNKAKEATAADVVVK
jgi:ethanolamine-phosphate cytidylyltransferase